jgi:magnesium-transporting ATPase (P-type)
MLFSELVTVIDMSSVLSLYPLVQKISIMKPARRTLAMKKYSYPYLFSVTILFLGFVLGMVLWRSEIYRQTFLNRTSVRYMFVTALALALLISLLIIRSGAFNSSKFIDYIKLYGAISIVTVLVAIMLLITATYYLPSKTSSYTTTYSYAYGSRNSCTGAEVNDADLDMSIRVCNPVGNYEFNNKIYIEKRTNALGMVVTYAITFP